MAVKPLRVCNIPGVHRPESKHVSRCLDCASSPSGVDVVAASASDVDVVVSSPSDVDGIAAL